MVRAGHFMLLFVSQLACVCACEPEATIKIEPLSCDLGTVDIGNVTFCGFDIANAGVRPVAATVELEPDDGQFVLGIAPFEYDFDPGVVVHLDVQLSATSAGVALATLLVSEFETVLGEARLKACIGGPCDE